MERYKSAQWMAERELIKCAHCDDQLYASWKQNTAGYLRFRCLSCGTEVLLSETLIPDFALTATAPEWEAELTQGRTQLEQAHQDRVEQLRNKFIQKR